MNGRVVLVAGGARGIGLAISSALSEAGARTVIGDLDRDLVIERAHTLGVLGIQLDVRKDSSFLEFLETSRRRLGPVDALVNCAGLAVIGSFTETSDWEHDLQIAVNLGGVARGMRLVLPSMLERGTGRIVNLASIAGSIPAPGAAIYSATKAAVVSLTDAIGSEIRGTGVYVTAISPTFVATEMSAGLRTRGIPKTSLGSIVATVFRVLTSPRPATSVTVPRWMRLAALVDSASPGGLRAMARRMVRVEVLHESPDRRAYNERIARQLAIDPHAGEKDSTAEEEGQERT